MGGGGGGGGCVHDCVYGLVERLTLMIKNIWIILTKVLEKNQLLE